MTDCAFMQHPCWVADIEILVFNTNPTFLDCVSRKSFGLAIHEICFVALVYVLYIQYIFKML